ncbi:DNA-3-methyladenine glycosylase [Legionella sp. PATHC035]|uniref:DNA-3-methyladenine glycosylase n=1 Tax=Legionella sp. PATHC035 TaxID=2992040 RepID=UPI0022446D77|nr:DNA-3-methyladenine glycosylase [Legionella sp. PATHC035]MCW8410075.1 DNA-3-methyladenine glycosylase [Legionella sp. PATHC035]
MLRKLSRAFYERDTIMVAKELLGKYLIHNPFGVEYVGRIVEVEAYLGAHDLASHSSKGLTQRTKVMFGPAGYAYIYLIYGMYYCTNVVTETEGSGSAILLRAIEPIKNIQGKTQGPGLLSKAMHIDKALNQHDLTSDTFYIAEEEQQQEFTIVEKPRIGVHYAKDWAEKLLRFYIKDNAFISKP